VPGDASFVQPDSVLLHHYDFGGNGIEVVDRVAGANGVLVGGAELDGTGAATLDGEDDYVDLPNHMLSELTAVTFVASLAWNGGGCWQRVFDFGRSTDGEDTASNAETSFFVTPASCPLSHTGPVTLGVVSAMFHVDTSAHTLQHDSGLVEGERAQLAVSAATTGLTIFVDGQLVGHLDAPLVVAEIDDVNAWLGRSQWRQDPTLAATLFDFRIYGAALSQPQVALVYQQSLDAP
jgi:arabinan endo-1,5-alpha-L-arabinosidase